MMISPMHSPVKGGYDACVSAGLSEATTEYSFSNTISYIGEDKTSVWKKSITINPKKVGNPHIFIVKRINDDESTEQALNIIKTLSGYKSKIFVEEASFEELDKKKPTEGETQFHAFSETNDQEIDLLITIGGDGTVLWALQYFNQAQAPPILAFSKGTRNYLCNFAMESYEASIKKVLDEIANGKPIQIEHRDRIQCEIKDNETGKRRLFNALNEVAITRGCNASLAKVECLLEERYLASFEGDGVMIATPTGSTAYQLSAGGPVINHMNNSMCITPIAPINLTTRPLVLPNNLNLSFKMAQGCRKDMCLNIDGQVIVDINKNHEINITGAPAPLSFLMAEESDTIDNWIFRLRSLVGWNSNPFGY